MISTKRIALFIILLSIFSLSHSENHNKPSIELEGVVDGGTYKSPIQLNFIVKNMKVLKAGIKEKNSGHHHLLINLDALHINFAAFPLNLNILHITSSAFEK